MRRSLLAAMALIGGGAAAVADSYSPEELASRAQKRRAVEAVIWGMPAVNTELMFDEMANVALE